jgi:hypothetical protein
LESVDGEANRSEPAAKISGKIKKTQMQSRRRLNLNAFQRAPLFPIIRRVKVQANLPHLCETLRVLPSAAPDRSQDDEIPLGRLTLSMSEEVDQVPTLRPSDQNATVARWRAEVRLKTGAR